MKLFERYMDDFNQAAIVPPPGSQYDNLWKKVAVDPNFIVEAEYEIDWLEKPSKIKK